MIETISGIIAAIVIIVLSQLLSRYFTIKLFAATNLVAIAFIYIGFSLSNNPVRLIVLESVVALAFYFIALMGYARNNKLIGYGIILHGIWDILHHKGILISTVMPNYWPSFCLTIDIIVGLYFILVFKNQSLKPSAQHQKLQTSVSTH